MMSKAETGRKIKVIMDANAFFVPARLKIDVFQELKTLLNRNFELLLLKPVKEELRILAERGPTEMRKKATYALKLAEKCSVVNVEEEFEAPDDLILRIAGRWSCPVFTNDSELRKKLRNINVPVIYVRQKSRLEMDGRL